MVTRAITSWLLCLLIGAGALTPRTLASPCCQEATPAPAQAAADHHDCCAPESPAEPDRPERDEPCPGDCTCPRACCAAPAPIFASGTPTVFVLTVEPAGIATLLPQTSASCAHALSLLRPPRL